MMTIRKEHLTCTARTAKAGHCAGSFACCPAPRAAYESARPPPSPHSHPSRNCSPSKTIPNPNHFRPLQHHRHCLTRSTPPQQSIIDMGSRMRKYVPSGEEVQVVPELVVEPLGPHLRHSGVVEAPEHLGVNLQLVVVVFKESLR
ncbi:hypothetical protein GUJ93_ZPchr0013g33828 [Zizania palustris]|uniref:Uncharacterized protein n=1 Tax=Zizania palustris TaxID=103762 RepID=A0A8J5X4T0_ZIZPA|nr:hypothetical protein GUJ93_ZPchr0013g33828 [Zizania palustris]